MPAVTPKRRRAIEPCDEIRSSAGGMSGYGSFLDAPAPLQAVSGADDHRDIIDGLPGPTTAIPHTHTTARQPSKELKPGRIRKALQAEDGHSLAEQAVYEALWQAAVPVDDQPEGSRTIRIGYHRLGQLTRLSWVSVKANLRTLEKKLAIEVTGCENSATREGKCYLVYSRAAILDRRKRAGLEWVRRTRGVELLSQPNVVGGRSGPKL